MGRVAWFALCVVFVFVGCAEKTPQDGEDAAVEDAGVEVIQEETPIAVDDVAEGRENFPLTIDVLANDSDPNGDALTITDVEMPGLGSVQIRNGAVSYAPALDFDGEETFGYTISDVDGNTATAQITVTIVGSNDRPLAVVDLVAARLGGDSVVDVLANDTDPEGDVLNVDIIEMPVYGSAQVESGQIRYTPRGDADTDRLRYRISDPDGASAEAEVVWSFYETIEGDGAPLVMLPKNGLTPRELAVVINTNDPVSVAVGAHYATERRIPSEHIIEVAYATDDNVLSVADFGPVYAAFEAALPPGIQAIALTGVKPYRVGCMSITSAFALGGYDDRYCNTSNDPCSATAPVETFASETVSPFDDHGVRPTMIVGGLTEEDGRALIDRGVAADGTFPTGVGHLVHTTDGARSVRNPDYLQTLGQWSHAGGLELTHHDNSGGGGSNHLTGEQDVLFYFTGLTQVPDIETHTYRPGAIADHLTSFGGRLTATRGQMSIMRWLEAGASGSYGTAVEPCNYTQKFPRPSVLLPQYFRGNTLLEAYWKSVEWPGEGVFVGEPLARPWGRAALHYDAAGQLTITTTLLEPGRTYTLEAADGLEGPFDRVQSVSVSEPVRHDIVVPGADRAVYRLVP